MKVEFKWIITPFIAIGSILLALIIYVNFRNTNFLFTTSLDLLGLIPFLNFEPLNEVVLPLWIVNSLPDGLWMLAFSLAIIMIWDFKNSRQFKIWFGIGLSLGVSFEIMQWFNFFPGTFDLADLFFIIVFGIFPILFLEKNQAVAI